MLHTGVQVSLISKHWLQKNISKFEILDLKKRLDDGDKLQVQWGNSTNIPFVGWVNLKIELEGEDAASSNVPFLVTTDYMDKSILGFYVIMEMPQYYQHKDALVSIFTKLFRKLSKVQAIFKSIQQENQAEPVYTKMWINVQGHPSIRLSCKVNLGMLDQRMVIVFTPDTEFLPERISIPDSVVLVKSGAALRVKSPGARGIPKEADTFTRDDTDIGDVDTRKMNIKLKDQVPVQKNCDHIQSHSTKKLRIF